MNENDDRLNINGNNWNDNNNGHAFGMALALRQNLMKAKRLYKKVYSIENLTKAWKKARKHKTQKQDIIDFEKDLQKNLILLHLELKNKSYTPKPLQTFILRDPKTRKISKSDFRDRVVHHALINIVQPIFEPTFIYDSCANQIGKGNLFAIKRFDKFSRIVSKNFTSNAYCLKADIRHYFQEIDHEILMNIIKRKVKDGELFCNIFSIRQNNSYQSRGERPCGMPLGNFTSQFFANVYLNELDYFVKYELKIKYYLRYVDDFLILHNSQKQLEIWKNQIDVFLKTKLRIELHQDKTKIVPLIRGIDFVGFRNYNHFKLMRKRNIRKMRRKIELFRIGELYFKHLTESHKGWQAYAKWSNTYNLRENVKREIIDAVWDKASTD